MHNFDFWQKKCHKKVKKSLVMWNEKGKFSIEIGNPCFNTLPKYFKL